MSRIADIVARAALFIGALRPEVVAAFVFAAGAGVLVGLAPGIEGNLAAFDVGSAPAAGFVARCRDEGLQSVGGGGVVPHRHPVGKQGGLHALFDEELGGGGLGAAKNSGDVGNREAGEQAEDGEDHEELHHGETARGGTAGESGTSERAAAIESGGLHREIGRER